MKLYGNLCRTISENLWDRSLKLVKAKTGFQVSQCMLYIFIRKKEETNRMKKEKNVCPATPKAINLVRLIIIFI